MHRGPMLIAALDTQLRPLRSDGGLNWCVRTCWDISPSTRPVEHIRYSTNLCSELGLGRSVPPLNLAVAGLAEEEPRQAGLNGVEGQIF